MNMMDHLPALVIAVPLLGAFLTPLVSKINDKIRNLFVIFVSGLTAILVFLLANQVFTKGIQTYVFGADTDATLNAISNGIPLVRILFEVDALSALMAIIGCLLPLIAIVYSWAFMKEHTGLDKYYTLILLMTVGMLGMMLTGDLFNFFVFLEITSISSAALIAFYTDRGKAVAAGFKYIVISSIGALFVLLAVAIFYGQYDALNIAVIANNIQYGFLDKIALVLLIAALGMKSGLVPMHMWLPDAYGRAPASVTLAIIPTTLASFYGILRVSFTLYGKKLSTILPLKHFGDLEVNLNIVLAIFLILLAVITIVIGVLMALKQSDLKRMIAYAAVAEIGYMLLAIGSALAILKDEAFSKVALTGGLFHIINDALDIGLLFLVAGAIYYSTRETSLNKLGGLARNMKYTTIFFLIGLLAVSGIPPMNGFASKLLIYESVYLVNPILSIIAILCSILMLAVFVKIFHSVFLGPKQSSYEKIKEVPKSMLFGMAVIAGIIIFFGLFPNVVVDNMIAPAVNALTNSETYINAILAGGV